jgi:hypothetical protein
MMQKFIIAFFTFAFSINNVKAQKPEIFQTNGKAINGYDAVAYFSESRPVKGFDSLFKEWNNSLWYFSTKTNLELFIKNPEQYAPQYGGYCAYGTAGGYKAPTQPDAWAVVDGKLYFNYSNKVKEMWEKDKKALLKKQI